MGLWKFLKWTFQKRDATSGEDFGLSVFQREGVDMFSLACWEGGPHGYSLWLEIWQALMAGRLCVSHVECWSYRDKREDGRKTEIFYKNTFPMCYAQDHLRDHAAHTLLTDGWKDIYSVGTGIDRQMIETLYAEEDLKTIGWTPYDCTPNFWQGLLNIVVFCVYLGWLPSSGFSTPAHWILPAVTIGTSGAAAIMRTTRSTMLETIRQDYIRTARAKGASEKTVIWKHALTNTLIPVSTVIGIRFGSSLAGSVVTEQVFGIPGLGKLMIDSINNRNYPVVLGGVLLIAFAYGIVNLIVDIFYAFIDPRVKSQYVVAKRTKKKAEEPEKNAQEGGKQA